MISKIAKYLQETTQAMELLNRTAAHEAKCDRAGGYSVAKLDEVHLLEALGWLIRANDAIPYGGLSRGFSFGWNPYFPKKGWQPAHPKEAGEVIPTFLDSAAALGREDLRRRAIRLADWLLSIQMSNGAIRGGVLDEPASPEVFNTARVIIGWIRAFRETGEERYIQAARRGADFLLLVQDPNRSRRSSVIPSSEGDDSIYCSETGWALIMVGIALEEYRYCAAGEKNVVRSTQQQRPNGWFRSNCLQDSHVPLVHTIALTVEGILESALILDNDRYFQAAKKTADALLGLIHDDGSLSGRFDDHWSPGASWSCLVGNAQMVKIWLKLYQATGERTYLQGAERMINFLKRTQNRATSHPGIRGGIKGSFPCDGEFGRYQTLSSGAKFFVDALISFSQISESPKPALCSSALSLPSK